MTPKEQDKLASLMLEDLREIMKTEVDENLKEGSIYGPGFYQNFIIVDGMLPGTKMLIDDRFGLYPKSSGIHYYTPESQSWREWFLDCLEL